MKRLVCCLLVMSCGDPSFPNTPPSVPHEVEEDGALHAVRYEHPFECGDPNRPEEPERGVACPSVPPTDDALLSCDAAGCHGVFDFTSGAPRQLYGGEGPSCYTCHGEKWDDD